VLHVKVLLEGGQARIRPVDGAQPRAQAARACTQEEEEQESSVGERVGAREVTENSRLSITDYNE
jgi:hypothetical protein